MKKLVVAGVLTIWGAALPGMAQSITPPLPVTLEKELAERASKYTEVSLDGKMLEFASRFLNDEKDDAEAKQLIGKLNGIYVREYDFDKTGQYSVADLEHIRSQFKGLDWSPMVRERSKKGEGDTDVYMKVVNGKMQGMFVLDAEPKELSFVFISGDVDPAQLSKLEGHFGIPDTIAAPSPKRNSGK